MALFITIREEKAGATIVEVSGRLDVDAAAKFEAALSPISENPTVKTLVFDCSGLEYVASAGLRVFLQTIKNMSAKKARICAVNLAPTVRGVLDMTGLLSFMEVHSSVAECLS